MASMRRSFSREFKLEAVRKGGIVLDRHFTADLGVASSIDLPHAPCAEAGDNIVVAGLRACF